MISQGGKPLASRLSNSHILSVLNAKKECFKVLKKTTVLET